jgi:hypothetical protein
MAHNAYIRALGVWNATSVALSSELATLDLRQFQAVNGDLGGVWAPSSAITIGGSGLAVTGLLDADDADITIGHGRFLTVLGTAGGALGTVNVADGALVTLGGTTNISATGTMHVLTGGGKIVVDSGGAFEVNGALALTIKAGATVTQEAGSTIDLSGQNNVKTGAFLTVRTGGTLSAETGTTISFVAGSVVTLAGTNAFSGTQTITGTTHIGGTVNVPTGATFAFDNGSSMSAGATAPFALANIVTCSNQVEFASGCVTTVQSGASFVTQSGATVTRGATETRTARVILSGANALTEYRRGKSAAADATFDPSTKDIWQVPAGLAGNIIYTLSSPAQPCVFTFTRIATSGAFSVTINRAYDGATMVTLTAATQRWADIIWDGTVMETIRGATL